MQVNREDITDNLPKIAAYVAGGLLLGSLLRRRSRTEELELELENAASRLPWATITMAAVGFVAGGVFLTNQMRNRSGMPGVRTVEESIELEVPVSTAYNQWTQFEEFPRFMASVENVKQIDDTHLHWRAIVAGKPKEWDAEITEQIPDERIAWRSVDGVTNAGVVTFHKIGDNRTRVMLQMDYQPETLTERVGDALGGVKLTAKGNLKRFKQLVESRGQETGAWRGTVTQH
jgi:uncharacterized membrane protein